ncbi:MAG: hypothetical protein JO254_04260 [Pseudolabrys sp.]|nr:hypothetical protein [Pseudolabrys sp.]
MRWSGLRISAALLCALALGGCMTTGQSSPTASRSQGPTVAFESIDGPPPEVFRKLVNDLNDEAQSRRIGVMSREGNGAAYRVRGYLAAHSIKPKTSRHAKSTKPGRMALTWVWDVYDAEQNRALRITGEETVPLGKQAGAWDAADDAMVRRIARSSMEQIAAFLTASGPADGSGFATESEPAAASSITVAAARN